MAESNNANAIGMPNAIKPSSTEIKMVTVILVSCYSLFHVFDRVDSGSETVLIFALCGCHNCNGNITDGQHKHCHGTEPHHAAEQGLGPAGHGQGCIYTDN